MKREVLDEIKGLLNNIQETVNTECPKIVQTYVAEVIQRITVLCESQRITNNGASIRKYQRLCQMDPKLMEGTEEYHRMLNLKWGEQIEIECEEMHFKMLRAMVKKQIPTYRVRTMRVIGNRRLIARVDL